MNIVPKECGSTHILSVGDLHTRYELGVIYLEFLAFLVATDSPQFPYFAAWSLGKLLTILELYDFAYKVG